VIIFNPGRKKHKHPGILSQSCELMEQQQVLGIFIDSCVVAGSHHHILFRPYNAYQHNWSIIYFMQTHWIFTCSPGVGFYLFYDASPVLLM
jgi:hypothetical protein